MSQGDLAALRHDLREALARLRRDAGLPTWDSVAGHAKRRRHDVSRSALAGVETGNAGLRWATVKAFVDACASYAEENRKPLAPNAVNLDEWEKRFLKAFPPERSAPPGSWPRRVGVVPRLAHCFQPRALIDEIVHAIDDGGTAVLTGSTATTQTRLLSGMGGVGKTQLAAHLANYLYDAGQLDLLVWISAASRQAIIAGYAQAAVDLSVRGADGKNADRDADRFHAWLITEPARLWLIIIDDLTNPADLKGLWPPIRTTGRTVVTTRLRGSALTDSGQHLIPVDVFTPEEAATYLQNRLGDHHVLADDLDGLAAALYYLPLALAHAAAYMIDERVTCTDYQRRLSDRRHRLDDLAPLTDELPDDYTRTVAATVGLSVRAADRTRPVGLAIPLLNLASVLDPSGVPISVFATTTARRWLTDTSSTTLVAEGTPVDVNLVHSGLRCLHRLNLITLDDTDRTVAVHGLVQRVARDAFTDDRLADVLAVADMAIQEVWDTTEVVDWQVISMLLRIIIEAGNEERRREVFGRLLEMADRKSTPEAFAGAWDATYVIRAHFNDLVDLVVECLRGEPPPDEAGEPVWTSRIGPEPRITQEAASTLAYCFTALKDWREAYDPREAIGVLEQGLNRWTGRRIRFLEALALYEDRRALDAVLGFVRNELAKSELDPEPLATAANVLGVLGTAVPDARDECVAVLRAIARLSHRGASRAAIVAKNKLTGEDEPVPPQDESEIIADLAIEDGRGGYTDWKKVEAALDAAAKLGKTSPELLNAVGKLLGHQNVRVAVKAAEFLGRNDDPRAAALLSTKRNELDLPPQVRAACSAAIDKNIARNSRSDADDI